MKRFAVIVAFFAMLLVSVSCDRVPGSGKITMKDATDSISYALGYLEAHGWKMRLEESPLDSIDMKSLARGFSKSIMREGYADFRIEQFGSFNEEIFKKAFLNQLAFGTSSFTEITADAFLRAEFEKAKAIKDSANIANAQANLEEGTAFLTENSKRPEVVTLASGLQYEILVNADGKKPTPDNTVTIHYHGTLIDGTVFDSSVDRGEPMVNQANGFIQGWNEALQLMSVGSKWKLYIPPHLAYGEQGAGDDIGPNETLIFEVELLGIE